MTFTHVWSDRWAGPTATFDGLSDDYDRYSATALDRDGQLAVPYETVVTLARFG